MRYLGTLTNRVKIEILTSNLRFSGHTDSIHGHVQFLPSNYMSGLQKLLSLRNLTQLGGTIRQVLASKPNDETIRVHGWVKSVRLQKRIAFAMIHDGTTPKGLQVVFQNPTHAKVSVCSYYYTRIPTYFLHKLDKWCKCLPHGDPRPKSRVRSG
jgi:hypothetical protein